jgi:biotin transport system ATP-binding protein
LIVVRSLSLSKASRPVLREVSFTLETGITLLAGANGAGKTLLTRCLLGLEEGMRAEITLDDVPWNPDLARTKIGYVIQDPQRHFLGLTCAEEVSLGRKNLNVQAILKQAGLDQYAETPPFLLSGGEQRRLALANVMAQNPRYLILDEPFNALDWEGVKTTLTFLLELKSRGVGVLLVTHDLEKCLAHVDQVILLKHGQLLATGTVEEVWDRFEEAGVHPPYIGISSFRTCTWL